MGGTVTHTETVQIVDVNGDGKKEIIELFTQIRELGKPEDGIPSKEAEEIWCFVRAYRWDGSLFAFDRSLSEQFLESLGPNCAI